MAASPSPARGSSPRLMGGCAAILALATVAAYHNTFQVPFLFDDTQAIVDNPTIRDLGDLRNVLGPDIGYGITVSGRPVLNLSLALCYAVSGTQVWSYHVFNVLIHILAGLTLCGIVRRTLLHARRPADRGTPSTSAPAGALHAFNARLRSDATLLAWGVALLWTLHPLQTGAVTYIIQRAESLMGLFFLLTLYGFIRAVSSPRPGPWRAVSVLACLAAIGTKEVAAAAPLLVFLYDRTFVAGTFRAAWQNRRWLHLSLAATWVPLALLVAETGWNRGGTAGFVGGVALWEYWLTQLKAIAIYLKLSVWPHPLVFEYGLFRVGWAEAALYGLVVAPVLGGTVIALRRWPAIGFLGAWFLTILAPTSVLPGTLQLMVEHRMYLPLAAVITGLVVGLHALLTRLALPAVTPRATRHSRASPLRHAATYCLAGAVPLALLTAQRNRVYRDDLTLWQDTVARSPASALARNSLGTAWHTRGRPEEALQHFRIALDLDPTRVDAQYNTGLACAALGRPADAVRHYREALHLNPLYYPAHYQLGLALLQLNRPSEALAPLAETVRLNPHGAEAHYAWGVALARVGRRTEAVDQYQAALRLNPRFAAAECDMGTVLFQLNRVPEAMACFQRALQVEPDMAEGHFNLGLALARTGAMEQAIARYTEAVRLRPAYAEARFNLGLALAQVGRINEALGPLQQAAELEPASAEAHGNFGMALARAGRLTEAIAQLQTALQLRPRYASAHYNLGAALSQLSRLAEAREHFEAALEIDPHFEPARQMLERLDHPPER